MKKLLFTLLILFGAIAQVSADENKTLLLSFITDEVKAAWMTTPGWTRIWAFQTGYEGSWYSLTDSNSDGIYEVSIPNNCDKWLLVCGTGETPNWDKKLIQSGDIDYASDEFYFRINNTLVDDNWNIDINNGGVTKLITSPKSLAFNFASEDADWFKDNAWVRVEAWKNGGTHYLYDVEKPTDLKCTVSVPDNVDYWQLVRGSGDHEWNRAGNTAYKNAEDYIFTFSEINTDYVPTSSIIFKNMSIIGNLTGDGTFDIGQEVEMKKVSPDIAWAFEVGKKINIKLSLEPTAAYHCYRLDCWDWRDITDAEKEIQVDINEGGWVTIDVTDAIYSRVSTTGFRIHGHGIYVEKVTKGEDAETGDVLWEGKHYVSWDAINNSASREWGNPNTYIYTVNRFAAAAQTYQYKAIANHKYGVYELPSSGNNNYTFNEAGDFELTFSVDKYNNTLVLEAKKYVSVGASGYATFSSNHSLDFSGNLGVKAYRAEISAGKVILKQANKIPYGNGVMIVGKPNAEAIVPFTSGDDLDGKENRFVATDGKSDIAASTNGSYNYVFSTSPSDPTSGLGFYKLTTKLTAANVKVGGAYLHSNTELAAEVGGSSRVGWIIDGEETTGINQIENAQPTNVKDAVIYNLNGQRVMNPAKGLYIVNGKKVIIK